MEKFGGENVCSAPTSIRLVNCVNQESPLRWRCGCLFTFVGASCGRLCDSTAFLFVLCFSVHICMFDCVMSDDSASVFFLAVIK